MKRKRTWIKTSSATHLLQNNCKLWTPICRIILKRHYAIAIIITLEGNEIMNTEKSRRRLRVIWLLISFNENAPSSEDGEKLQNLSNHLITGKKKYFKALIQLGHFRVKDVFVGTISKNCTKIRYINQHHDILFLLFNLFCFFFSLWLF